MTGRTALSWAAEMGHLHVVEAGEKWQGVPLLGRFQKTPPGNRWFWGVNLEGVFWVSNTTSHTWGMANK